MASSSSIARCLFPWSPVRLLKHSNLVSENERRISALRVPRERTLNLIVNTCGPRGHETLPLPFFLHPKLTSSPPFPAFPSVHPHLKIGAVSLALTCHRAGFPTLDSNSSRSNDKIDPGHDTKPRLNLPKPMSSHRNAPMLNVCQFIGT